MNVAGIIKEKIISALEKSGGVTVLEKISGKSYSYVLAIIYGIKIIVGYP